MKTCIVYAHGGSYTHGSGDEIEPYRKLFEGAEIVKVDYTLFPKGTIGNQIREVTATVRAAKKAYNRVIVMGYSAGGHLACMAGNAAKANGIILIAPPLDFNFVHGMDALKKLPFISVALKFIEPISHATKYSVPTLIIQGQADKTVLPEGTRRYVNKAHNCILQEVPNVGHTLNILWERTKEIKSFIEDIEDIYGE
jgi:acetyl esterase/lipase